MSVASAPPFDAVTVRRQHERAAHVEMTLEDAIVERVDLGVREQKHGADVCDLVRVGERDVELSLGGVVVKVLPDDARVDVGENGRVSVLWMIFA